MSEVASTTEGWAAWHPKQGFEQQGYALAYMDMDDACEHVSWLNKEEGTTNKNGWRAVRVAVSRVET